MAVRRYELQGIAVEEPQKDLTVRAREASSKNCGMVTLGAQGRGSAEVRAAKNSCCGTASGLNVPGRTLSSTSGPHMI